MLEKIVLDRSLDEKTYKSELGGLQRRLYDLEKTCWDNGVASIVVFEGWDGVGRGKAIATLTSRLDPRGFKLNRIVAPRTHELQKPWLWRFWVRLPAYGEMAIFDRSWYGRVLHERVKGRLPETLWRQAYRDITEFERMQADDGVVIVKFWMHISKKEQKRRLKALEKNPFESWRVTEVDWQAHKRYDEYLIAVEEMLHETDSEFGPWTIVEATDKYFARRKVVDTVIGALQERLGPLAPTPEYSAAREAEDADLQAAMSEAEVLAGEES